MCYLVTSYPPATNGLRVHNITIFEPLPDSSEPLTPLERAMKEAARLLDEDHSDVRIWKLHATPVVEKIVVWNETN